MDWGSLFKIIPQLGAAALVALILGGLIFWLFYSYIPGLQKDFREVLEKSEDRRDRQAEEFRAAIEKQQTTFLGELEKQRDSYSGALAAVERAVDRLTNAIVAGGPK